VTYLAVVAVMSLLIGFHNPYLRWWTRRIQKFPTRFMIPQTLLKSHLYIHSL